MRLSDIAQVLGGRLLGVDADWAGVSTDSRRIARGELFVALRGERFDAHDFLDDVHRAGAAGAVVEAGRASGHAIPHVEVDDARAALGRLAAHWRRRFAPVVIAITGSNGKTTTKDMIAAVLREHAGEAAVLATAGNQNNDIGVPLTLLRMNAAHRFAAIELGMNHPGEIAVLAGMTRPTVALVNNAQREHLEFMNSVEAVADENASVFDALPDEGAAVINADDLRAERFRSRAGGRRLFDFALLPRPGNECSVRGGYAGGGLSSEIEIRTSAGSVRTSLAIAGEHNVRNALAAAACATAAGIPLPAIGRGLAAFRPSRGRMETKRRRDGAVVIDDSYNANPDSVIAAIDVLAECGTSSLLVLGDMGEVGADGPRLHAEAGRYARERGIGALYASGVLARLASEAFGPAGRHFDSVEELAARAEEIARRGDTVLVKGSRFMRMERVVQHLVGEPTAELH